jgi:hypothetical protein
MKSRKLWAFWCAFFFFLLASGAQAQRDSKTLKKILKKQAKADPIFAKIYANPDAYRVQILYTQIDRDKNNTPRFRTHSFRHRPNEYFYPASTVKFPACLLALEKINTLNLPRFTKETSMLTDSCAGIADYPKQHEDATSPDGLPSIAHYAKKILLVSDNDAFNRLFEFVGQEPFNETLHRKGYPELRITHRLSIPLSKVQNQRSNPQTFVNTTVEEETREDSSGKVFIQLTAKKDTVYKQPMLVATKTFAAADSIKIGKGFMRAGKLVSEPFDFTTKNFFPLKNQQDILKASLFPEALPEAMRFNLKPDDYSFLWKYMSQLPPETTFPKYDISYYDSYCKFLMFGDNKKPMPKNIRIFNKVGDAYGFLLDNAYIVDFDTQVEFMLTVVIYCNSDGIFNDDTYDYDSVGFPFMAQLGKAIYDFELKRKRKNKPDLSKFKLTYDQ